MSQVEIDRAFLRTAHGLIHYRHVAGAASAERPPVVLAHGGPGSSAGLVPLIRSLGVDRPVLAPDMMGNGDSDPPPSQQTTIGFYAEGLIAAMDAVGFERVDLYGHHTGAQVVIEAAIARPDRVRRLVLDGVGLFPPSLKAEFLDLYAPAIAPEASGAHLSRLWTFITRTTQYFPHYRGDEQHRIAGGAPPPPTVATDRAAEVLKAWSTYHIAYGAAFRHDLAERLTRLSTPTLFLAAAGDPLAPYARVGADLVEGAAVVDTTYPDKAQAIRAFLDAADQTATNSSARAAIS